MELKVKKLYDDTQMPERANPTDSGCDVFAHNIKQYYEVCDHASEKCHKNKSLPQILQVGERALIGTGIAATVGPGYEIQVRSRSGNALKKGLIIANGIGTIDDGYRGEIGVIIINNSQCRQRIEKGDKIAQLVVVKVELSDTIEVDELSETKRGEGGFGSTGQ